MSVRAWWTRVRGSLRRGDALEREMQREMEFHLDMATRRNVARGMDPETARREATLAFGTSFADDRGHALLSLGYSHRQGLTGDKRKFFTLVTPSSFIGQGTFVPVADGILGNCLRRPTERDTSDDGDRSRLTLHDLRSFRC